MSMLSAALLALAISMDGFGVGFSYGMRNIRIPGISLLVICLTSTGAITLSMFLGRLVMGSFPSAIAQHLGSFILVAVGLWVIWQSWIQPRLSEKRKELPAGSPRRVAYFRIQPLGIAVEILREPVQADFDRSGTISALEAVALGFALAMDALGAGFGAAIVGFDTWLVPIFVGILKWVLVSTGLWLGKNAERRGVMKTGAVIPGLILIFLGLWRI